jgi:hypothetical protein
MTVRTENILPTSLCLDDHIGNPHEGGITWVPIVGLSRDGDHVLIMLAGEDRPLQVSTCCPVQVRRHVGPLTPEADEAQFPPDAPTASPGQLAQLYVGDLDALRQAAREHSADTQATPQSETPAAAALRPLVAMYGGDLELVLEAIAGVAPDQVLAAARHAAMVQSLGHHVTPKPVEDEQASNEANLMVEERLGGWYAGDIEALLHRTP